METKLSRKLNSDALLESVTEDDFKEIFDPGMMRKMRDAVRQFKLYNKCASGNYNSFEVCALAGVIAKFAKELKYDFGLSKLDLNHGISELRESVGANYPEAAFILMYMLCHLDDVSSNPMDLKYRLNNRMRYMKFSHSTNGRLAVSPEDMAKAEESGVVQIKPNGSWGIISMAKGEWWDANYSSEESARSALKAYHARSRHSREFNSVVPSEDIQVADQYIAHANNDNYIEVLKKVAKELGEHFDVRKSFGTPNEFRKWAAENDKISDRFYIVLDYILGAVTGMKMSLRKFNSEVTKYTDTDYGWMYDKAAAYLKTDRTKNWELVAEEGLKLMPSELSSEDEKLVRYAIEDAMIDAGLLPIPDDPTQRSFSSRSVNAKMPKSLLELIKMSPLNLTNLEEDKYTGACAFQYKDRWFNAYNTVTQFVVILVACNEYGDSYPSSSLDGTNPNAITVSVSGFDKGLNTLYDMVTKGKLNSRQLSSMDYSDLYEEAYVKASSFYKKIHAQNYGDEPDYQLIAGQIGYDNESEDSPVIKACKDAYEDYVSGKNSKGTNSVTEDKSQPKISCQIYQDGSESNSYIRVDKMGKSAKVTFTYFDPGEGFEDSFKVGDVINTEEFCGVGEFRESRNSRQSNSFGQRYYAQVVNDNISVVSGVVMYIWKGNGLPDQSNIEDNFIDKSKQKLLDSAYFKSADELRAFIRKWNPKVDHVAFLDSQDSSDEVLKLINSRQVNSDLSSSISSINKIVADKGCKAVWDSENDRIEIVGQQVDLLTLSQEGGKYILSNEKEVVYVSSDYDKVIDELKTQLG